MGPLSHAPSPLWLRQPWIVVRALVRFMPTIIHLCYRFTCKTGKGKPAGYIIILSILDKPYFHWDNAMKYVSLYAISRPKLNLDVIWRLNSLLSLKNREFWQFWATQFFVICYCFASKWGHFGTLYLNNWKEIQAFPFTKLMWYVLDVPDNYISLVSNKTNNKSRYIVADVQFRNLIYFVPMPQ